MIKVADPIDGRAKGFELVTEVVQARVSDALFAPGSLDLLVEKTGGVLRHVFMVLQEVAMMANASAPITKEAIRYGLNKVRRELWSQISLPMDEVRGAPDSVTDLYDRLTEYAREQQKGRTPVVQSDPTNQLLIKTCALVEYNGKGWLGVHPLVVEMLQDMGRLP